MEKINDSTMKVLKAYTEDYDVPLDIVIALYDMMPDELYDGLVNALEDYEGFCF